VICTSIEGCQANMGGAKGLNQALNHTMHVVCTSVLVDRGVCSCESIYSLGHTGGNTMRTARCLNTGDAVAGTCSYVAIDWSNSTRFAPTMSRASRPMQC
jgi:hypothetical protein